MDCNVWFQNKIKSPSQFTYTNRHHCTRYEKYTHFYYWMVGTDWNGWIQVISIEKRFKG